METAPSKHTSQTPNKITLRRTVAFFKYAHRPRAAWAIALALANCGERR